MAYAKTVCHELRRVMSAKSHRAIGSRPNANKVPLRGRPCLTPLVMGNFSSARPLNNIVVVKLVHRTMMLKKSSRTRMWRNLGENQVREMEGKAPAESDRSLLEGCGHPWCARTSPLPPRAHGRESTVRACTPAVARIPPAPQASITEWFAAAASNLATHSITVWRGVQVGRSASSWHSPFGMKAV